MNMMNLMNRKAVTVVAMVSLAYAATRYNTFAAQALFGSTTCSSRHVDETTVSELKQQIKNSVQMMGASAQTVEITLDDITTAGPFGQNGGKKCDANAMLAITWVHNSQQTFPSKNI